MTATHDAALVLRGLSRSFGGTVALAPVDLELARGEVTGLVGPNGSGKSTLLRLLVGLVAPTSGTAVVAGVPLSGDGVGVRRQVAFSPGEIASYGELTCRQQLAFLLRGRGREARRRGERLAERLGLPLGARMRTFSHGMKRQTMFCAALAPDVPVRLLDEPTAGLDPSKRGEVVAILREDLTPRRCVLLSSHHFGELARSCERVLFLSKGRLVADERTRELERRARRLLTLEFAPDTPAAVLEALGRRLGRARVEGTHLAVELDTDDPVAALRRLPDGAPAPARLSFGEHSLEELYRDLYGVEGL